MTDFETQMLATQQQIVRALTAIQRDLTWFKQREERKAEKLAQAAANLPRMPKLG